MTKGIIFKKYNCPYCERASQYIDQIKTIKSISWTEIILSDSANPEAIKYAVEYVPLIVVEKDSTIYRFNYSSIIATAYADLKKLFPSETNTVPVKPTESKSPIMYLIVTGIIISFLIFRK